MAITTRADSDPVIVATKDWVWSNSPGWSEHKNGGNYLAKITEDNNGPGGVSRKFLPKSKGIKGFVTRALVPGDAFEIGSSDVNAKKEATRFRLWGVVKEIDKAVLIYYPCTTAEQAVGLSEKVIDNLPGEEGAIPTLQRRRRHLMELIAQTQAELRELDGQIHTSVEESIKIRDMIGDTSVVAAEIVQEIMPETTEVTPLPVQRLVTPSRPVPLGVPPAEDDDDDEELTPAQKQVLGIK